MKITYVTGNWAKVQSAKEKLEPYGIEIDNVKLDIREIQADDVESIAKFSAEEARDILHTNVLKNDTGFFVEALGGFPGPYAHYADDTIAEDGVLKLMEGVENRRAYFKEAFAYAKVDGETKVFVSVTPGTIALEKSGTYGWSWDFIFIPDGQNKTLANFDDSIRFSLWNTDGYNELAKYLIDEAKKESLA
jgi:XTP/dITP diphosphohydrolase